MTVSLEGLPDGLIEAYGSAPYLLKGRLAPLASVGRRTGSTVKKHRARGPACSKGSRCGSQLLIKYTIMYTMRSCYEWHTAVCREAARWEGKMAFRSAA